MNNDLYFWVLFFIVAFIGPVNAQPKAEILIEDLSLATAIDISPNAELFIVESGKNRVVKFDLEGKLLDSFGGRGSGDYQFDNPGSMDVTNGLKIYVTDLANRRIQIFDNRYQFIGSFTSVHVQNYRFDPLYINVDKFGNLFTYLRSDHMLIRFGLMGRSDLIIGPLQQYGIEKVTALHLFNDLVYIADSNKGVIHRFSKEGEYLNFISVIPGVLAMTSDEEYIYLLNKDTISIINHQGMELKKMPVSPSDFTGISIWDGMVYLLTESRLLRYKLP